jgi:hypothetical protein
MAVIGRALQTTRTHSFFVSMSGGGLIVTEMDDGWVEVPTVHEPIVWTRFEKTFSG